MGFSDALDILGGGSSSPSQAPPPAPAAVSQGENGRLRVNIFPQSAATPPAPQPAPGGGGFGAALDILSSPSTAQPQAQKQKSPISTTNAALTGVVQGLTGNFFDEMQGAKAASGLPDYLSGAIQIPVGAARLAYEGITGQPGEASKAYDESVKQTRDYQQQAAQEHPIANLAGNVAGALALPVGGSLNAATLPARIGRGAALGGAMGAVYGAGQGENVSDRASQAATGGVIGGVAGGAAPAILAGLGATAKAVGGTVSKVLGNPVDIARGFANPDQEAARRIGQNMIADINSGRPGMSGADLRAAQASGQPLVVADVGGENVKALARSAANSSPAARAALEEAANSRFNSQSDRITNFVRELVPSPPHTVDSTPAFRVSNAIRGVAGRDTTEEALNTLAEQARLQNAPAYRAAYAAGDRPIWSPELERLSSAPAIRSAINSSISKWQNYAVRDGYGAMNPPFRVENGRLLRTGGNGIETHPDIQLWDYVARNLQDTSRAAPHGSERARLYNDLARLVKNELDTIVPEYQAAREGAARFFGQRNALEAGQSFVSNNMSIGDARLALGRMQPAERQLFARGYAQQIIEKINASGSERVDNLNFLSSQASKQKMRLALGEDASPLISAIDREHAIAGFGGATGFREAGSNFVSGKTPLSYARQQVGNMSPQERALFSEGFASELADKVSKVSDNRSATIDRIFNSPDGRARIELALGKNRADELQYFLRRENMMDQLRKAMGNSTTARQLMEMGIAGAVGSAVGGAAEAAASGKADAKTLMSAALVGGAAGLGRKVNFKVAQRVGEMLASDDPKVLATALKMARTNPDAGAAMRRAETIIEKIAGQRAGESSVPVLPSMAKGYAGQDQNQ